MPSNAKVSVVIPTYNRPNRLRRALNSVRNQTYENIEVVVVDDHSSTSMENVVNEYSSELTTQFIRHSENKGANAARNTGIQEATGEYIAFLDDDDSWEAKKIEKQISAIQEENAGLVYTGIRHIEENGTVTQENIPEKPSDTTTELLQKNFVGSFSVVLVKSTIIQKAGLPDEGFPIWQDKEWYVRISQHAKFALVPEVLVSHHQGSGERISGNFSGLEQTALPKFIDKFQHLIEKQGLIQKRKIYHNIYYSVSRYALATGNFNKSRKYALRSLIYNPLGVISAICYLMSLRQGLLYRSYKRILHQSTV
ncbi:glycosyltransferase family 2 protein [Halogeometricum borinquense]|uniref:glycosyltransferase family 2 protein n=1 Tax=Halogeometricum borinquense TaxID=60847 RepID=UPI003425C8C1